MTAFDYGRTKATADRLIERFGQSGFLRRRTTTGPEYDPTDGDPADHACRFAVTDYEASEIDGSRVLATDKKALLAKGSLSIEPALSDLLVESDGAVYKIVAVKSLKPGSTVVLWELQCRR